MGIRDQAIRTETRNRTDFAQFELCEKCGKKGKYRHQHIQRTGSDRHVVGHLIWCKFCKYVYEDIIY